MDEDIAIINKETRNEKIKNFFIKNKKKIIISILVIILAIFGYFIYEDFNKKNKIKLANRYNIVKMNFISGNKSMVANELISIVHENDRTYSPLALYFLIDNNIIDDKNKILKASKTVDPQKAIGESIGIEKIGKNTAKLLFQELEEVMKDKKNHQEYYEVAYERLIEKGESFHALDITGLVWVEIDTKEDFELAKNIQKF